MAKAIMFQGTGSNVGKSVIAAGFCRLLANRGYKVAPFKAQNMALNSGVTFDGHEMGRAQILQAEACRVAPDVRMNPILIKPTAPRVSQLIRMGKSVGTYTAREYYEMADDNFQVVKEAYDALAEEFDYIVLEGAGSPAEINLQKTDLVNMRMADYAKATTYIIGDIDHGGVFAWMKGTYDLIQEQYRPLIEGFIINKFRGDVSLLQPGIDMFEEIVPIPIVGVLPYLNLELDEEDSQDLSSKSKENAILDIAVIRFPYISNFTDFSPLKFQEEFSLRFVKHPKELDQADIIILPGSKNTLYDLAFLKESGLFQKIQEVQKDKLIFGICGGFQMLGEEIFDENEVESQMKSAKGLGFFPMTTKMEMEKKLETKKYQGKGFFQGLEWTGYEIHQGQSEIQNDQLEQLISEKDICVLDHKKQIFGTYIHGIFDQADVLQRLLSIKLPDLKVSYHYKEQQDQQLDQLAQILEKNINLSF
ncbi:MAG: adenosylcobyric acid synthase [bacterium]|jgi:adenosylcobyric acid synthase